MRSNFSRVSVIFFKTGTQINDDYDDNNIANKLVLSILFSLLPTTVVAPSMLNKNKRSVLGKTK